MKTKVKVVFKECSSSRHSIQFEAFNLGMYFSLRSCVETYVFNYNKACLVILLILKYWLLVFRKFFEFSRSWLEFRHRGYLLSCTRLFSYLPCFVVYPHQNVFLYWTKGGVYLVQGSKWPKSTKCIIYIKYICISEGSRRLRVWPLCSTMLPPGFISVAVYKSKSHHYSYHN